MPELHDRTKHAPSVNDTIIIMKIQCIPLHDDVIIRRHFPRYWPFVRGIHRSPVNSPHKGQWRRALMFSLICAWINGWANNGDAGDLRRHRAHHDVMVMKHAHHFAVVMQSNVHRFKLNRPVYPCSSGLSVINEVIPKERGIPNFMETQHNTITCESIRMPDKYCRFTKSLSLRCKVPEL